MPDADFSPTSPTDRDVSGGPRPETGHPAAYRQQGWQRFHDLAEVWPEWLVENVLPQKSLICLYGKRGLGKTFLALDWACSIVSGRPWLDHHVGKRGNVAYVLAERPEGLRRRILGWLLHQGLTVSDADLLQAEEGSLFVTQDRFAFNKKEDRTAFLRKVEPLRPLSLIVLDPLAYFMDGSENETRDMQAFIEGLLDVSRRCECSILLVHHEGKGNRNNIKGARGSSALEAGMDTVLRLKGKSHPALAELEVTKQREFRQAAPLALEFIDRRDETNRDLGQFPVRGKSTPPVKAATKHDGDEAERRLGKRPAVPKTSRDDKTVEVVRELTAEGVEATVQAVYERMKDVYGSATDQPVRKTLRRLSGEGGPLEQIRLPKNNQMAFRLKGPVDGSLPKATTEQDGAGDA